MARTFPRSLLDEGLKSDAERKVFEALRDQLSDEWSVFHSASVIYRDHAEGALDDEGDFVLCHPGRGIVCLEVKGGGIECRHRTFYRLPAGGPRERMADPFGRALDHRYALERKIAEVEGWKDGRLFLVHALAFPDIKVHQLVLGPDAPPQIVADRNDLGDMAAVVERVLAYHEGSRDKRVAPGPEGEAMLEELLAPTFRIEVPMATLFEEEDRQLVELTEQQAALLNHFGRDRRMVVTGCAGSGKTMPRHTLNPLQRQVRALYDELSRKLGVPTEQLMDATLAWNFCPFRSPSWDRLASRPQSLAFSKQLGASLLEIGQPDAIVCLGDLVSRQLGATLESQGARRQEATSSLAGWGEVTYGLAHFESRVRATLVVRLPHLSRFAIFGRQASASAVDRLTDAIAEAVRDRGAPRGNRDEPSTTVREGIPDV